MKNRYSSDSVARDFRVLRTRIEAEVSPPAILLVTSATERDGTALTAFGLAESLSGSQRAVVVTSDVSHPSKKGDGPFAVMSLAPERLAMMSRARVASLLEGLGKEYDYTVVDAGDLTKNGFGLLVLASADGALVAFRAGRSEVPADRTMIDMLDRSNVRLLGAVMTEETAIGQFAQRDEAARRNEWVQRRQSGAAGEALKISLSRAGKTS